jgi:hypothetical protein
LRGKLFDADTDGAVFDGRWSSFSIFLRVQFIHPDSYFRCLFISVWNKLVSFTVLITCELLNYRIAKAEWVKVFDL